MTTPDSQRHRIIERVTASSPHKTVDSAIRLWEQMASQIISIVGEGGFTSLYARSVYLAQSNLPWLAVPAPQTGQRFAELKIGLEALTPAQASAANSLLLITFTDILASLIGDPLMSRILRSAWSNDASDKTEMELKKNE